ncbi:pilus assembly protein [Conchiformibius steedae DSM 2580]|uniref:Pilus assembly protein n=1 Tax=Conchiformibius steedae DSM 2580 TaxID=1121352 RepID=A0AAE9HTA9_9NEIS|nr:PilC/PilY family type IV pilus protein [Conchiformibius steedae]QMT33105.1 hypothetical protein H3L98_08365 [Conchiformibius steedae]URD67737.1 pilus assembly protein [Conchiformibius steedae DSM 2580]
MVRKKKYFMLKPLALLLGIMGLAGYAAANTAATPAPAPADPTAGPFAQVPLHIIQTTQTSGVGVKPNVVLQIDNSYSMYASPEETSPNRHILQPPRLYTDSRLEITKRALRRIMQNPQYRDGINWQMITLWDKVVEEYKYPFPVSSSTWNRPPSTDWWQDHARAFLAGNKPFARPPAELDQLIDKFVATGYTPTTERYFDAIYLLQKALERDDAWRCQKSAVIIFSDGKPNTANYFDDKKSLPSDLLRSQAAPMAKNRKSAREPALSFYLHPGNQHYMRINHDTNKGTDEPMIKFAWKEPFIYSHPNMRLFVRQSSDNNPPAWGLLSPYDSLQGVETYGYSFINQGSNSPHLGDYNYWTQRGYSLRFLAESVYLNDLRKVGQHANPTKNGRRLRDRDPSGKSYDAPPFHKQNIETYTIAFGIDRTREPLGFPYLKYAATGTSPDYQSRKVFDARSEESLNKAFDTILSDIASKSLFTPPASFAGISPTVSSDEATRKVPNMAATTHLSMKTGSSEIYFYEVLSSDQNGTNVNKNQHTTPSFGNRRVLINNGSITTWLNQLAANNAFFGIPDNGKNANEWQQSMIPWIMRSKADVSLGSTNNALKYRDRVDIHDGGMRRNTRNMGDVVYSPILAYGPNENGRQKYLMTAANDGMVYLFRSNNDRNHPYDLKLNYIPAAMERESEQDTMAKHFKDIVHPEYVQNYQVAPHRFMINGGFVMRTMDKNGPQQVFMAGNMGQGGRGMYALNVGGPSRADGSKNVGIDAPESEWTTSVPLMETPKGNANREMGYTINAPQIGRVALNRSVVKDGDGKGTMTTDLLDLRYAIFVNSGVSNPFSRGDGTPGSDNTESALYVYSPFNNLNVGATPPKGQSNKNPHALQQGELIKKIVVSPSDGKGGLAQPTLVDINFDGAIDIVYAGDYSGGVYRFDLRGDKSEWKAQKIFQTLNGQPITSAPAVFRNEQNKYIVIFGTGSDLYQKDLDDKNVQSMYGVYEDLTDFNPTVKYQSDLVQQTITESHANIKGKDYNVRKLSDNSPDDPNIKGWYFSFPAGERVVVKPNVLLKSVLFSTRSYRVNRQGSANAAGTQPDLCVQTSSSETSEGESWVMQVKVDNGGNIPSGKDANEVYAYADFLGQYEKDADNKKYVRPDELFAGFRSEGGIVNMALLFGVNKDPNGVGGIQSSYTRDGDAGDNGIDPPPDAAGENAKGFDLCVAEDDNKLLYNNTGDSKGLSDNFVPIHANVCASAQKGIVRRLSWRELF